MASKHTRKQSGRAPLMRRTTRGPLDDEDPLSASVTPVTSPTRSSFASPALSMPDTDPDDSIQSPTLPPASISTESMVEPNLDTKDLSFLLDPSIYHPLSQLDLPAAFRRPFPVLPSAITPLAQSLFQLEALLAQSDLLSAAHLAGGILASGSLRPTDIKTIFRLLGIRFSCLELTGNTLLAAQESKALEDLISTFYYYDSPENDRNPENNMAPPEHIMPFSLRLQALRLQSIGFSDPRRGVSALYDLGIECREHVAFPGLSDGDRKLWRARLEEIGVRVVNALIEMGDLDCALRTLEPTIADDADVDPTVAQRICLLYLKIGDTERAQKVKGNYDHLKQLIATAEGRYEDAAQLWEHQLESSSPGDNAALIQQNLAVAYLYSGQVDRSREVLRDLVDSGESFESLIVNLATLYELSSDRSKDLKMAAAAQIALLQKDRNMMTPLTNAAFKL